MKYVIYISDNRKPEQFLRACLDRLADAAAKADAKLITVTEKPVHRGDRKLLTPPFAPLPSKRDPGKNWWHGIFHAYLQGLSFCRDDDECYLADDDCLVPPHHFMLHAPFNTVGFNLEVCYLGRKGFFDLYRRACANMAGAYGHARYLRRAFAWKLDEMQTGDFTCYEPAGGGPRPYTSSHAERTPMPIVDIRIFNRTWSPPADAEFREDDPYWGNATALRDSLGITDEAVDLGGDK